MYFQMCFLDMERIFFWTFKELIVNALHTNNKVWYSDVESYILLITIHFPKIFQDFRSDGYVE